MELKTFITKMTDTEQNLLLALIGNGVTVFVSGCAGYFILRKTFVNEDVRTALVGIIILIGVLIVTYFRHKYISFSYEIGNSYMKERTGIVQTYKNLDACRYELQQDFEQAKDIRMLLQIGRKELGDGKSSLFYNLAKLKETSDYKIKVLRASEASPFYSQKRANYRKTPLEQWHTDIRVIKERINLLRLSFKVSIEDREHCEPFLWRIFIFDDIAYVSAYLYSRNNDSHARVFRVKKGENSLYDLFSKYFDYLWLKYDTSVDNEIERWASWQ